MRAALIVNRVVADLDANLAEILDAVNSAARAGAELVVLPEAATTGLAINGDPLHDLPLGQPIPGPLTDELAETAQRFQLHLAVGILERAGDALYDSAVLLCPGGDVVLHYRRIQPQWHASGVDPAVYRQGDTVPAADTPLGRLSIILCGDLFDDDVIGQVREMQPDWLLFPFARCFDDGSYDRARWQGRELPLYLERIRKAGCGTLMVNYLSAKDEDGYFGGAAVVSAQGEVIAHLPIGHTGTLLVDVAELATPSQ